MSCPTNIDRAPIRVAHASLRKRSHASDYRVRCPACPAGLLLVARDQETLQLIRDDRCISCGQRFIYTDKTIAGEAFKEGPEQ